MSAIYPTQHIFQLRHYQQDCITAMQNYEGKSALIVMATGLGKTATFTEFLRREVQEFEHTCLILSHREELVTQPLQYLQDIPCGVEIAEKNSHGEKIISASVQSLINRLNKFNPYEIDTIIVDEAHHAAAPTYRKVLDYFVGAQIFGFTATAHRGDGIGLSCVFEKIIFERDVRWGIKNNFLCDIECAQIFLKYDMGSVKVSNDDFTTKGLAEAMSGTAIGVCEIYSKHARGQTIIFAASIPEAKEITQNINQQHGDIAQLISSTTKTRDVILKSFAANRVKVLVNFAVLSEGVDTKNAETIIIARPVAHTNVGLYAQMVGRGLRPHPAKEKCLVIDCVGISRTPLCTAATLLGDAPSDERANTDTIGKAKPRKPLKILTADEIPGSWVRYCKKVNVWAKKQGVYTHNVFWFPLENGAMILTFLDVEFYLEPPDKNNFSTLWFNGKKLGYQNKEKAPLQKILDYVFSYCQNNHKEQEYLWNKKKQAKWAAKKATPSQIKKIQQLAPNYSINTHKMTRGDASSCINKLKYRKVERYAQTT